MKKLLITAVCAVCASMSAHAVSVLEYNIAATGGLTGLPLAPNSNTLNASTLTYVGAGAGIADVGQVVATGWQTAANAAAVNAAGPAYVFTVTPAVGGKFDFSAATVSFGASSSIADTHNIAVFANGALVGSASVPTGLNQFGNYNVSLASLGEQTGAVEFKLVGFNTSGDPLAGLDTGIPAGTQANLALNDVVVDGGSPIPEPHEYAMLAGLGLVGFAVYRRRKQSAEAQA